MATLLQQNGDATSASAAKNKFPATTSATSSQRTKAMPCQQPSCKNASREDRATLATVGPTCFVRMPCHVSIASDKKEKKGFSFCSYTCEMRYLQVPYFGPVPIKLPIGAGILLAITTFQRKGVGTN